jgi:hypothetical protein
LRPDRFTPVLGKVEHPALIDELVAKVNGQSFERCQDAVVVFDAAGPEEDQQIG